MAAPVANAASIPSPRFFRDPKNHEPVTDGPARKTFADQMNQVKSILKKQQLINEQRLDYEVEYYYGTLGLSTNYFELHTAEEIAQHVGSLYAAKELAHLNGSTLELELHNRSSHRAVFLVHSMPGSRHSPCTHIERNIEQNFLGEGYTHTTKYAPISDTAGKSDRTLPHRLLCFRTKGTVSADSDIHLRMYLLAEPKFKNPAAAEDETDLQQIADQDFLTNVTPAIQKQYHDLIKEAVNRRGPVIKLIHTESENTKHLLIAYRHGTTHSFFSGLTDLYHSFGLYSPRKYIEQFSNGISVFDIQLYPIKMPESDWTKERENAIVEEANLVYILPRTSISSLFTDGIFSANEHAYAYAGWKFAFHFLSRQSDEFAELAQSLQKDTNNQSGMRLLSQIKSLVRKEAYSEARIMDAIFAYPQIVKELYKDFERRNQKATAGTANSDEALLAKIIRSVPSEFDRAIITSFLSFNQHILRTNFFQSSKVALSFRLNPAFLSKADYPKTPFAVFFVVGPEFRGFHIRFRDIARGGIRIVRSANLQSFIHNVSTLFDENYNLAATQERKNKDIAEGGSKGTILLSLDHQDKAFSAFKKYVDALLDLLLPNDHIVDRYGKEEILFLGPDEGTAGYMDWASQHAHERGYKFWKSFTTGKSRDRGGIPHDHYGMTTRSIHQYVVGVLSKLGLDETKVKKLQTGGPDGDLGSNEIKISSDKTIAVVDGSGVLYDPEGIHREELRHLATQRVMARSFDKTKLSPKGFFVDVDSADIVLPDKSLVPNGMDFRNNFHLNPLAAADIFVPCGGRPESISISNVGGLLDEQTKRPRWNVIVEGANLFLTQEARLFLEKNGVVIFKDASANKGGVTSSSLEVLAALSLTDEEFEKHMCVKGNDEPKFYTDYVIEVQSAIEANARLEFNCLWTESERSKTPRSILSDTISNKINDLSGALSNSELWNNANLRRKVLSEACPKTLQNLLGLDAITKRVPENYIRAVFGCWLASRYVYSVGLSPNPEFSFFTFISKLMEL